MSSLLRTSTYALWLTPSRERSHPFGDLIRSLATELSGPLFPPHLTLQSGFPGPETEILRRASGLAQKLPSFTVSTEGIGMAAPPFRALFLPGHHTPDLLRARTLAQKTFGAGDSAGEAVGFLPHISIFYGIIPDDRLASIRRHTAPLTPCPFPIEALQVVAAFGPPPDWRILRSIPLPAE